jgi:hypothetical protein
MWRSSFAALAGVERHGLVPEHAQHFHALAVVPDCGGDRPARFRDSLHFAQCLATVRDEIDDQERQRAVERRNVESASAGRRQPRIG